jgi:glycine/D-amino acid oxidase-like deaminating enzyme
MSKLKADAELIICGAGIAGIAAAYFLSARYGYKDIILLDRDQPMSYTSSKSGENYRDYWPQACMGSLMERSIDLMESFAKTSSDGFSMRGNGYHFVSFDRDREIFPSEHLREYSQTSRMEQITGRTRLQTKFPYLSEQVQQLVHIKRAGPMDVYALASYLLAESRKAGVRLQMAQIESIRKEGGRFTLQVRSQDETAELSAEKLVLTAGPMNPSLAAMLGVSLPVQSILQRKFVIPDPEQVIPRDMPYTIFSDPQHLGWTREEQKLFATDPEYRYLIEQFPGGLHIKPESSTGIKLGWAYNRQAEDPQWQPPSNYDFPNIVLKGASKFIPGLAAYVDQVPTPVVQFAGYYTRTPENWPLIGPLNPCENLFTIAALSGFGTMAACGAGELLAQWMSGDTRPDHARYFHPDRYSDPEIVAEIDCIESDGQL